MSRYLSELKPTWRLIKDIPPPKATKLLFKPANGPAVIGVWYEQCGWDYWCPLPSHTEEQKIAMRQSLV